MKICGDHAKCVDDSIKMAEQICKNNDLRFTNLRKKVFSIILNDHKPFKAYDILSILQKDDPAAKPITIYRCLDFLLDNNFIHKLHLSNSYIACSDPEKLKKCSFLICDKCNDVIEYCNQDFSMIIDGISNKNNFKINNFSLEIRGICDSCNS